MMQDAEHPHITHARSIHTFVVVNGEPDGNAVEWRADNRIRANDGSAKIKTKLCPNL